jgi:hypothetical protein
MRADLSVVTVLYIHVWGDDTILVTYLLSTVLTKKSSKYFGPLLVYK